MDFRPIRDTDGVLDHQISVCVRKRPMNKKELESKEVDIVTIPNKERIIVHEPKLKVFKLLTSSSCDLLDFKFAACFRWI